MWTMCRYPRHYWLSTAKCQRGGRVIKNRRKKGKGDELGRGALHEKCVVGGALGSQRRLGRARRSSRLRRCGSPSHWPQRGRASIGRSQLRAKAQKRSRRPSSEKASRWRPCACSTATVEVPLAACICSTASGGLCATSASRAGRSCAASEGVQRGSTDSTLRVAHAAYTCGRVEGARVRLSCSCERVHTPRGEARRRGGGGRCAGRQCRGSSAGCRGLAQSGDCALKARSGSGGQSRAISGNLGQSRGIAPWRRGQAAAAGRPTRSAPA